MQDTAQAATTQWCFSIFSKGFIKLVCITERRIILKLWCAILLRRIKESRNRVSWIGPLKVI